MQAWATWLVYKRFLAPPQCLASSRSPAFTTTLPVVLLMVTSCSKSRLVPGRDVFHNALQSHYRLAHAAHHRGPDAGNQMDPFLLEDLDYPDDLALRSQANSHIQEKTRRFNVFAKQVGPIISGKKTDVMALNTSNRCPVHVENEDLPYMDKFTYLNSIISKDGEADLDIQSHLNKTRSALNVTNKVWRSSAYSTCTKQKIYHICVVPTLLYGLEC